MKPMNKRQKLLVLTIGVIVIAAVAFVAFKKQILGGASTSSTMTMYRPSHPIVQPDHGMIARPPAAAAAPVKAARPAGAPAVAGTAAPITVTAATLGTSLPTAGATPVVVMQNMTPDAGGSDTAFMDHYAQLERTHRLLSIQVKNATLRNKLNALNGGAGSVQDEAPAKPVVNVQTPPKPVNIPIPAAPAAGQNAIASMTVPVVPPAPVQPSMTLIAVLGVGQHYSAVVSIHGLKQTVRVGDRIADNWTVTGIWPRHIVLHRHGAVRTLRLGG